MLSRRNKLLNRPAKPLTTIEENETMQNFICSWCEENSTHKLISKSEKYGEHIDYSCREHTAKYSDVYCEVIPLTTIEETETMERYRCTAGHTQGKSIGHCCSIGVWDDPTETFEIEVEAVDAREAERIGCEQLLKIVNDAEPCPCQRHEVPGYDSWWESVAVTAERLEE